MEQEPLTTRLRKPFAYQDSDSDSLPSAIDEEEQESLIQNLSLKNSSQNTTFRQLLIAIPILSAVPFLLPSPLLSLLTRLLAIKSLLATSFLIYALRPEDTGFDALNAWAASQPARDPRQAATGGRRPVYGLALAAKIVMAGVDPESELRALKYDYKGA
ncbi:unnamed protein product [Parascedosporium putredinis]|uniref:Uncharacterized protein n=1 Tax=Parascedosporium putredinis TaxID=1442378 RepID=A0A9P1H7C5_9PEZI|nr:unnamed protein product [Parascedosporium putredinis]CAI8001279.1 unnamed protein product [Parascedosporium putredinis]